MKVFPPSLMRKMRGRRRRTRREPDAHKITVDSLVPTFHSQVLGIKMFHGNQLIVGRSFRPSPPLLSRVNYLCRQLMQSSPRPINPPPLQSRKPVLTWQRAKFEAKTNTGQFNLIASHNNAEGSSFHGLDSVLKTRITRVSGSVARQ